MADILRLCGIAVLGLCAVLILREKNAAFATLCGAAAVLVIVLYILEGGAFSAVQTIAQAAKSVHCRLRQVEYRTQSADHPILWSAEESYYQKFYIFQVRREW